MKNKLKLLIVIIFISFITSGCTLNYNLTIKDDRSIVEMVSVTEKNNVLTNRYGDYKKEIDKQQKFYKKHQIYYDYSPKKIFEGDISGLSLTKTYPYGTFNNSPNKTSVFNKYSFYEENGSYIFRLTYPVMEAVYPDTNDSDKKIDDAYLNIKSYLKVLDSNSDSYDEKTKTYTWHLDKNFFDNNKDIYIKLSKEKDNMLIFSDFIMNHLKLIIGIGITLFVIVIAVLRIYKKYKNGMKI